MLVICIRLSFSNVRPRGPLCVWPLLAARADLASCNGHENFAGTICPPVRSKFATVRPAKALPGFRLASRKTGSPSDTSRLDNVSVAFFG